MTNPINDPGHDAHPLRRRMGAYATGEAPFLLQHLLTRACALSKVTQNLGTWYFEGANKEKRKGSRPPKQ